MTELFSLEYANYTKQQIRELLIEYYDWLSNRLYEAPLILRYYNSLPKEEKEEVTKQVWLSQESIDSIVSNHKKELKENSNAKKYYEKSLEKNYQLVF